MTPKEKAEQLFNKYYKIQDSVYKFTTSHDMAKQCALICVDEIIKALRKGLPEIGVGKGYWYNVREEINKL
jgi:hypothetical protein